MPDHCVWNDTAADGDFQNDANWSPNSPANGDSYSIPSSATPITVNVDQSAKTFTGRCSIGPGVRMGASGAPFKCAHSGRLVIAGAGVADNDLWIESAGAGIAVLEIKRAGTVDDPATIHLLGDLGIVIAHRGVVSLEDGSTCDHLLVEADELANGALTVENLGCDIDLVHTLAGTLLQTGENANADAIHQMGGIVSVSDGEVGAVEVSGTDAEFNWSASSKTIASVISYGGTFRPTGVGQTITATEVHESATHDGTDGDVTYTNPVKVYGGTFLAPTGATVAVA